MSDDPTFLTPAEARARFGDLLGGLPGMARVCSQFEDEAGVWRAEYDGQAGRGLTLRGYRLLTRVVEHKPKGPFRRPRPKG